MAKRSVPVLASDVARSYIGVAITLVVCLPLTFGVLALIVRTAEDPLALGDVLPLTVVFLAWTVVGIVMTVLTLVAYGRAGPESLHRWLVATTPDAGRLRRMWWGLNGGGAIYWALGGTFLTVITLVSIAASGAQRSHPALVAGGVSVVVTSVVLIVVSYAVRYARERATAGGFEFPGGREPRFADYLYLAVQVTTTFGGSDVTVTTTAARKLVAVHSLVAFAFNTVIVALLVSVLLNAVT